MAWNLSASGFIWVLAVVLYAMGACGSAASLDWPPGQALPSFPEASRVIDTANITLVTDTERLLLLSLQGVVNRNQPRVYLYWNELGPFDENPGRRAEETFARRYWVEELQDVGFELNDLTSDPFALVTKYQAELSGAVLFDPQILDTVNLATTVAGIHGGVVATEALASQWSLPVLEDFRGRFADRFAVYEYGLAEVFPKVTNRLVTAINPRVAYGVPNITWTTLLKATQPVQSGNRSHPRIYNVEVPPALLKNSSTVYVRFSDAFNDTGFGPSVYHVRASTDDDQTLATFDTVGDDEFTYLYLDQGSSIDDTPPDQREDGITGVWRYADGTNSWIYRFTVPATSRSLHLAVNMSNEFEVSVTSQDPALFQVNTWLRDYIVATAAPNVWLSVTRPRERELLQRIVASFEANSVYMGWFPDADRDEQKGVTLLAEAGLSVLAADFFTGASFLAGVPSSTFDRDASPQPQSTSRSEPRAIPPTRGHAPRLLLTRQANSTSPSAHLHKKIYINIVWPEGDNIQYCQNRMRAMWDDPARGDIPQGWTISPLLRDTAPSILAHYQSTATANDFLITGPNGAGYTYPINWTAPALDAYLARSGAYMRDTGLASLVWVYNRINRTDIPCSEIPEVIQCYEDAVGPGLLLGIMCGFAPLNEPGSSSSSSSSPGASPFADGRLDVNFTASGLPVSPIVGLEGEEQAAVERLERISAAWNSTVPLWLTVAPPAFRLGPADVARIVRRLGPEFEVLRPDVFYADLRAAYLVGGVGNARKL